MRLAFKHFFPVSVLSLCPLVSDMYGAGYGFDVLTPPAAHTVHLDQAGLSGAQGAWMRVRGVVDGHRVKPSDTRSVESDRTALRALRDQGIKIAVLLRWNSNTWEQGTRAGGGHRLPLDLREAYERGRRLGETYGDLVDVWEIDNEPDIDFVADNPETYAAFLKAIYLGLHDGHRAEKPEGGPKAEKPETGNLKPEGGLKAEKPEGGNLRPEEGLKAETPEGGRGRPGGRTLVFGWLERKRGWARSVRTESADSGFDHSAPRVIMAPLALPPGPFLERLWANGVGSYTDGFNFHYYGYAEDFTGVYRQFEDAVKRLSAEADWERGTGVSPVGSSVNERQAGRTWAGRPCHVRSLSSQLSATDSLPVFITEYGYGLLDADARNTAAGRVRQWRWFAGVVEQIGELRPTGTMAFVFNPYFEAKLNEFGLTTREPLDLAFVPADFGLRRKRPWMERIGKEFGGLYASPALAYLWDFAERHPYRPREWSITSAPASTVVVDFVSGSNMVQAKSSGGYDLAGASVEWSPLPLRTGRGTVVLYNFGTEPVSGSVEVDEPSPVRGNLPTGPVTLAPGERRELPVVLTIFAEGAETQPLRVRFVPSGAGAAAVFSTLLGPSLGGLSISRVADFSFPANAATVDRLAARSVVDGEPRLTRQGRWLTTDGVRVEERDDGVWRFYIDHLPAEPLRPASVELPLPDGFVFKPGTWLSLERRKAEASTPGMEGEQPEGALLKSRAGKAGNMMDVYFRTENGNLFQTWPRLRVSDRWVRYVERAENFTMGFFGRAELPWRFAENDPVSLVFFLRPAELPAVFEVRNAEIVRIGDEG